MTKKATFYILTEGTPKARDLQACRVIERLYALNQSIYVHTANETEARKFETQLWTFKDISFVPHLLSSSPYASEAPVVIGSGISPEEPRRALVNLTTTVPEFYQKYPIIIELVPADPELKAWARKRYQTYQNQGYLMENFKVSTGAAADTIE